MVLLPFIVWPTDESAPTKTMPCERRQDPARPHTSQLAWSGLKLPTNRQQLFHQGYAGSGLSVYDCSDGVDIWFRSKGNPLKSRAPCSFNYNTSCARLCLE